jgi:hypothetical protein
MLSKTERSWRHMARDIALSRPVWRSVTCTTPASPAAPAARAATTSPVMQFLSSIQLGAGDLHHLRPTPHLGTDEAGKLCLRHATIVSAVAGPDGLDFIPSANVENLFDDMRADTSAGVPLGTHRPCQVVTV